MIMGILNVTPDSFSDGGAYTLVDAAVDHALRMIDEGASIIDIGGESTRPGALKVDIEEELERTIPVIETLRKKTDVLVSIDTSKAEVARRALVAGADIVNDVTGLTGDEEVLEVCVQSGAGVVVMHMQGNPRNMQNAPAYDSVVDEVRDYFEERYQTLTAAGVDPLAICFDPGIGFGKTLEHNKALLKALGHLSVHDCPLMLGVSRKSMIGAILDEEDPLQREWGTVALTAYGRKLGAQIHRVHAVKGNSEALRMIEAIAGAAR